MRVPTLHSLVPPAVLPALLATAAAAQRPRVPPGVELRPDIVYREGKSRAWRLDLVLPKERGAAPRPGLVFVHGGGWRGGDKRRGYFLQGAFDYARAGYVCITVNYRLSGEAPFPACVEDVKCAVRWFRAHAGEVGLDPGRIGGFGNSAGAHLVAMLGLCGKDAGLEGDGPWQDRSSALQAVCAAATPADFVHWPGGLARFARPGSLLAGPLATLTERAERASPVRYARAGAPPFLLFHGTNDRLVDCSQADALYLALVEAGAKDVTYYPVRGAGHGVFQSHRSETIPAMRAFFDRTLRLPKRSPAAGKAARPRKRRRG